MPPFRPTRTSSPSTAAPASTQDLSSSFSQLAHLTSQEIRVLDAVIQRAGPTTNALSAVYQAYTETIRALDLDPKEVTYYDLLLSLWKVKGRCWGDKWDAVIQHFGYRLETATTQHVKSPTTRHAHKSSLNRAYPFTKVSRQELDSETEDALTDIGAGPQRQLPKYQSAPRLLSRRSPSPVSTIMTQQSTDISALPMLAAPPKRPPLSHRWQSTASEGTEEHVPSSTLPSYHAAIGVSPTPIREVLKPPRLPILNAEEYLKKKKIRLSLGSLGNEAPRRSPIIDDEDTWEKIRKQRDEKFAEEYYIKGLCRRVLWRWYNKHTMICDELERASAGRDCIILEVAYRRWQANAMRRVESMEAYAEMSDKHSLIRHFTMWRKKYTEKKQAAWRDDMRRRMKIIQDKRNRRIQSQMWGRWYQMYLANLFRQQFSQKKIAVYMERWYHRLVELRRVEAQADAIATFNLQRRYYLRFKKEVYARLFSRQVDLRILSDAMIVWQKRLQRVKAAEAYHSASLQRRKLNSWKRALDRIKELNRRQNRHRYTQNAILIRAVWRVWAVRAHAPTNERILAMQLLQRYMDKWKKELARRQQAEEIAIAFAKRPKSSLISTCFEMWRNTLTTHRNAHAYAAEHYLRQLRVKAWIKWQDAIITRQQAWHSAKLVHNAIQLQVAWQRWRQQYTIKRQQVILQQHELKKAVLYFRAWQKRFLQIKECRLIEQELLQRKALRIMRGVVTQWQKRLLHIRQLQMEASRLHELECKRRYFETWRLQAVEHRQNRQLLDEYLKLKQKEFSRRIFRFWLNAARTSVNRKLVLREREHQFKVRVITKAWQQWRMRHYDEVLRPLEIQIMQQAQRNLFSRAMRIWHANTKSLPVMHLRSTRLKSEAFERWRQAIAPFEATKKARELCRKKLLTKHLAKWMQAHRTRLAHKALARARYLRVAPALSHQTARAPSVPATAEETTEDERTTTADGDAQSTKTPTLYSRRSLAEVFLSKGRTDDGRASAGANSLTKKAPTTTTGLSPLTARSPTITAMRAGLTRVSRIRNLDQDSVAGSDTTHRARAKSVVSEQPIGRRKLWEDYRVGRERSKPPSEYSSRT